VPFQQVLDDAEDFSAAVVIDRQVSHALFNQQVYNLVVEYRCTLTH